MDFQTTIKKKFTLSGPGLHTGVVTRTTVCPADASTGIRFCRTDLHPSVIVPALAEYVTDTNHGTTIAKGSASVSTIEHLMSALHGMQIDNAIVEIDGPEVPILDGSARLWVEQIVASGVQRLNAGRQYVTLAEPLEWSNSETGVVMRAFPSDSLQIECNIQFKSQLIGSQSASFGSYASYADAIAPCRTFVFLHEVEFLLSKGLIRGGDLDNALVFVDKPVSEDSMNRLTALFNKDRSEIQVRDGLLNTVKPYFPNEPARHKLLDFIGDIYLVGSPVKARFELLCPGHYANSRLANLIRQSVEKNKKLCY